MSESSGASAATPLVSVIIPTHNRADLLARSIRSVLCQSYRQLELIVVDDASTDDTASVVKAFDDERLIYLRREQGGSAAAARNKGLEIARGELVAFQDDDDIWLLDKLERQVAHLLAQPEEVGLSVCSMIWMNPGHRIRYVGGEAAFQALDYRQGKTANEYLIATPGWLVRKRYLDEVGGFDPEIRSWDDWELGLRLWRVCRFTHLDEPLLIQDRTRGSMMIRNRPVFALDMETITRKHGALWADQPAVRSRHAYVIGHGYCRFVDARKGRVWLWRAFRVNPANLRAGAALLLSYMQLYDAAAWLMAQLRRLRRFGREAPL